jgi:hypothetical protein
VNLQALDRMVAGGLVADVVAIIGTLDIVLGEVDNTDRSLRLRTLLPVSLRLECPEPLTSVF